MTERETKAIARLKRMKTIRMAVISNYNGLNSDGAGYGGTNNWCWEDGSLIRNKDIAKKRGGALQ